MKSVSNIYLSQILYAHIQAKKRVNNLFREIPPDHVGVKKEAGKAIFYDLSDKIPKFAQRSPLTPE